MDSSLSPFPFPLKVRMALHTGAAEERDGDYFGPPLNRVARLLAIGYGGQVLVSAATQELTQDSLPARASLQDVGHHRLRDLGRPESVFQLLHPDLPSDFPPLRSLDNPDLPNNLPQQVTSFIGREKEIGEIKTLLSKTRLLTLTGSGGCGKTRLCLQIAAEVLEDYSDGVWLVELASLRDPALVPQAVAQTVNVAEEPGKLMTQTLVQALKSKHLLLLLDNCEHLLSACAQLVAALIRACPHVRVLASSREGLNIAGELTYRVSALSLPERGKALRAEQVRQYEAARLFIERALFHQPAFTLTNHNAPALVAVCHRLDGIPLAIELAAARVRSLTVEQVASRLDDQFRLLTGGSRTALPHHQTLRAAIDWSYDLLSELERILLRRLSVFAGGWTLEAAEFVCTSKEEGGRMKEESSLLHPSSFLLHPLDVLDLLTSLVDKSLVLFEERPEEEPRYRLLESVRRYSEKRLEEAGELQILAQRHLQYYSQWAQQAETRLFGPEQALWLNRLETEHDNLRAALAWGAAEPTCSEDHLRMAVALARFWDVHGYLREGREWLAAALARPEVAERTTLRMKALIRLGNLAWRQSDAHGAQALFEESLQIAQEHNDRSGIAWALFYLGVLAAQRGQAETGQNRFEESLRLFREIDERRGTAAALNSMGSAAIERREYAGARKLFEESLKIAQQVSNRRAISIALVNLGLLAYYQQSYAEARAFCERSLALQQELGDRQGYGYSLQLLGLIACENGDRALAQSHFRQSLETYREIGQRRSIAALLLAMSHYEELQGDAAQARAWREEALRLWREVGEEAGMAHAIEMLARSLVAERRIEPAAEMLGAAHSLHQQIAKTSWNGEEAAYDRALSAARVALGEEGFAQAWERGRALSLTEAADRAQQLFDSL